jgi:di/tricarboxylate transporter
LLAYDKPYVDLMEIPVPLLALLGLVLAIIIGVIRPKTNTGAISLAVAFLIGMLFAGLSPKEIAAAFPSELFLMLLGLMMIFSMAQHNGTLDRIAKFLIHFVRGKPSLFPFLFFLLAFLMSALGPGNIAAVALIAPLGMAIAVRAGISPLLMGIMICTGANAGAFSPIAPTGVISTGLALKIGVDDQQVPFIIFLAAALLQASTALGAYFIFRGYDTKENGTLKRFLAEHKSDPFEKSQKITLAVLIAFILAVMLFKANIILASFLAAAFLAVTGLADSEESIKLIPWSAVVLLTGVIVLVGLLEKTGALDIAVGMIARYSGIGYINAVLALITGIISAYSSSSGVVMPTFIPLIPGLIEKMGGGDPVLMLISVAVGSHMVDVSPLSTLGAIVIASYSVKEDRARLFRSFLIWGLSMAVVGALLSFIFLDLLGSMVR